MKNNIYENFSKEKFNKDNNYKRILDKTKEERNMKKIKISNLVAVVAAIVIVVCISPTIYAKIKWNIEFKDYQNREYETCSATLKEAVENGYYEDVDMAYVVQDGIGVKVDSLIITDDYFESKINFKFADDIQVPSDEFRFGYAVYDNENNIYCINTIYHDNAREDKYTQFLCESFISRGYEYQEEFEKDYVPIFKYKVGKVEITKMICMEYNFVSIMDLD